MKNAIFLLSTIALSASAYAAQPKDQDMYFYLGSGNIGYETPKFGNNTESELANPHITIGWGKNINEYFSVEGVVRYTQSELKFQPTSEKINLHYYQFGVSGLATSPYLGDTPFKLFGRASALLTQAEMYIESLDNVDDNSGVMFNVGGGLQWDIDQNFWLKAEYVYGFADVELDDFYDKYDGFQISIGKNF
ncbi:porin family protein [Vibrio rotiferianus]|uniref:Porin family protein n=1 Tax=Vibrio rotiferianus TaxID=190895 RepID=A0A7Y3ZDX9_9VIBR|nr:porin family protein [Vibrio rotiferianus]NOH51244.1 porin family protein [Vibrio rotiferianus]